MIILLVFLLHHFAHAHTEKAAKNEFAGNPVEVTAEMQTVITEDSYLEVILVCSSVLFTKFIRHKSFNANSYAIQK